MYKLISNIKNLKGENIKILLSSEKIIKIFNESEDITEKYNEIKLDGEIVSPAWIDIHTHSWDVLDPYGDNPDNIGINQGVPIIADAGSSGFNNIEEFYSYTKRYETTVYAFANLAQTGIIDEGELKNLNGFSTTDQIRTLTEKMPDFIKGIKIRISSSVSGDNGLAAIKAANKINEDLNIKTMMHIGNLPPSIVEVIENINSNYIITHAYNGKQNGIFPNFEKVKESLNKKVSEGVLLDVGHGTASFSFESFKKALENNLKPQLISTDIYKSNREDGPVHSLALVASKCHALGLSLEDTINAITRNPAKVLGISGLQNGLTEGMDSKLTFFKCRNQEITVSDSDGIQDKISKLLMPTKVFWKGGIINVKDKHLW